MHGKWSTGGVTHQVNHRGCHAPSEPQGVSSTKWSRGLYLIIIGQWRLR